jgi:hypothetical protein
MQSFRTLLITGLLLGSVFTKAKAQDLMSMLEADEPKKKEFEYATFKGTRNINFHTLETPGVRTLEYRISHRFGTINSGMENFYGLDGGASIRMGLEYSHNGRLTFGIGRSNIQKTVDGYAKFRLIRQTTDNSMPISVTVLSNMFLTTAKDPNASVTGQDKYAYFVNRFSYAHQVMIGRKFNEWFSFQIAPTVVHFNIVDKATDKNDIYATTFVTRIKVTKRVALTAEYCWRMNEYSSNKYYNSMGFGIDIETGGHVFQMHFTNSLGMIENQFIPYTSTSWADGGVRLGFNISRVFSL